MSDILTVGDLKRHLANFPDDWEVQFPGNLTFYRTKARGPELVAIEFNEAQAILSPRFKRKHPSVVSAFFTTELDGSVMQPMDVPEL